MTTRPDHDSVAQPPPTHIPRSVQVIAGGLALAALIALGSSTTLPAGPTLAGSAVCQQQVVVNFRGDADLDAHEQELRTHPRVTAITVETREQVLEWYRALVARAGHPELGRLMRVEAMPARAWLAAAKTTSIRCAPNSVRSSGPPPRTCGSPTPVSTIGCPAHRPAARSLPRDSAGSPMMPDIAPPPAGPSSSLRGVTIGAFVLAGVFALTTGLTLYAATHRPMPPTVLVDRAVAGWDANCGTSAQIAVDFATDHEMEVHVDQLRAHLDVVDIYAARQRENGSRHRMLLRALAAGPDGYEALVRDEDQSATVWLRLAQGTDDGQFADVLRAELGSAAQAVRVDVPCLTVNVLRDQVDRLRDYPTRCLTPTTDPAGQLEIPAGCPPIP